MTKKAQPQTEVAPEVLVPEPEDILSKDELAEPRAEVMEMDTMMQIVKATRGENSLPIRTALALTILEDGHVPPEAIRTRPGYPKEIPYASHIWGTRTLNAALRWLWDFEVVQWEVFEDGSVATRNKLTIHIPYKVYGGQTRYHVRKITEIGSFEAYPKKDANGNPIVNAFGKPEFTMNTADRVASSASRGLMKCMLRAFNIGTEFSEKDEELTPKLAWNMLLKFGKTQGLTRDAIVELLKSKGVKGEELTEKYQYAYELIYNYAKNRTQEEVPL